MPSHQFDKFTGRLKNSTNFQPLSPIAPVPLQQAEPPKMIWDSIKTKPATILSGPQAANMSTCCPRVLANQKKFQPPNYMEKEVWKMGGRKDKVLFGITCALMLYGFVDAGEFVWRRMWIK
ncbi:hypothetical protein HCN44_005129 [Aphidius gifuensis]|uniref:Uncharacterized protein n=1 Tax=Aphidius gifuensis TaxID=684658 RepID=A0A834XVE1_APHGI|nr:uncharacterized protein LOC122852430 [Aphidius gifuensis]KAF7992785.1 hypothetical protein HCN44_005129 [Aphidius gifuensis]